MKHFSLPHSISFLLGLFVAFGFTHPEAAAGAIIFLFIGLTAGWLFMGAPSDAPMPEEGL